MFNYPRVCPICKLAFRIGDPGTTCDVPPDNKHGAKPGHYASCTECGAHYRPDAPHLVSLWFQIDAGMQRASITHGDLVRSQQDPDPTSRTYGVIPGGSSPAGLCGLCLRWAREDDRMDAIRLYREDFPTPEEAAEHIAPQNDAECWMVCSECKEKWKPAILARLKRQKIVPETLTVKQLGVFSLI